MEKYMALLIHFNSLAMKTDLKNEMGSYLILYSIYLGKKTQKTTETTLDSP